MSAAFTSGPWRVRADSPYEWRIVQVIEFDGEPEEDGVGICAVPGLELSTDDDEANARLIAAAPKLYAALALFEQQWNACGGNSQFGGVFQNVRDAAVEALSEADASHWLNAVKARGAA